MLDETRVLVGCKDPETNKRTYKVKYMWGIRANSANLSYFIYEMVIVAQRPSGRSWMDFLVFMRQMGMWSIRCSTVRMRRLRTQRGNKRKVAVLHAWSISEGCL